MENENLIDIIFLNFYSFSLDPHQLQVILIILSWLPDTIAFVLILQDSVEMCFVFAKIYKW